MIPGRRLNRSWPTHFGTTTVTMSEMFDEIVAAHNETVIVELEHHISNLNYAIGYSEGHALAARYLRSELELAESRLAGIEKEAT